MRLLHSFGPAGIPERRPEPAACLFQRQSTERRMVWVFCSRRGIYDTTLCRNFADRCHANLVMRNAGITGFGHSALATFFVTAREPRAWPCPAPVALVFESQGC